MKIAISIFFGLLVLLLSPKSNAQQYNDQSFYKVDSLAENAKPKEALALIEAIYEQANKTGNTNLSVKAAIYSMLFQTYLTEDALVVIINRLKTDIAKSKQPEKSILQSVLGSIYWNYYLQNRYRISQRTFIESNLDNNVKTWSILRLNKEISNTLLNSVHEKKILQSISSKTIQPLLKGDTTTKIYRTTLYDILAHRAIDILADNNIGNTPFPKDLYPIHKLAQFEDFLIFNFQKSDTTTSHSQVLQLFQELISFNLQKKKKAAWADVELKRLNYLYQNSLAKDKAAIYNNALNTLANEFKDIPIYTDFKYQQAALYHKKLLADTSLHLVKAVNIAEKAIAAYPKSLGAYNASNLIERIKGKELNVQVESQLRPLQPSLLRFSYRNIDTLFINVYRTPVALSKHLDYDKNYRDSLKNKKPIKTFRLILPNPQDYQTHSQINQLDGLPTGQYILGFFDKDDIEKTKIGRYVMVNVSNLIVTHRADSLNTVAFQVRHAKNGEPIAKAKIEKLARNEMISGEDAYFTNKDGIAVANIKSGGNSIITYQNDTITINNSYYSTPTSKSKRLILFTDRPLYRPGQTVYYKGILMETSIDSNRILPSERVLLTLKDVNRKDIAEIELTTNEFGSVQGSFNIPQGKLNGQMTLQSTYGAISVRVEEYKRPTFEVVYDAPTQKYKLNDSVKVYGKAISYAGYPVANAKLSYTVMRRSVRQFRYFGYTPTQSIAVANGNTVTKVDGKFDITFLAKAEDLHESYAYEITASVTHTNGENRRGSTTITAGKKDLIINDDLPQQLILGQQPDTLSYTVTNLNKQPINASLKTTWFALMPPNRLVHKSLLTAEAYHLNYKDFSTTFPYEAYKDELSMDKWAIQQKVLEKELKVEKGRAFLTINQNDLSAGYYKVISQAINAIGDTVATTQYVRTFHESLSPIFLADEWLIAEKTTVKSNENAIFRLAGLNKDSKVYYEVYYKDRVEQIGWIAVSPMQKIFSITAKPAYAREFAVQFTMINNGRRYSSFQKINIIDPKQRLDIKFISFRDKLQPGEKETWKLQISNGAGEKEMAEMVATLYDASLDDMLKGSSFNWSIPNYSYFPTQRLTWFTPYNTITNSAQLWQSGYYLYQEKYLKRNYAELNLYGLEQYRGDNTFYTNYIRTINERKAKWLKLAELAKGDRVYGLVIDDNLNELVTVLVSRNDDYVARSGKDGIYIIDAQPGDELIFSLMGFQTQSIKVGKDKRVDVTLLYDTANDVVVTAAGEGPRLILRGNRSISTNLQGSVAGVEVENLKKVLVVEDNTVYSFTSMEGYDPKTGIYMVNGKPIFTKENVTPRTNFNELAFFYPQLKTNENGEINIAFTIPQSLTRYKMMGFAHTKGLKTASVTNQLITQKQLAVSVNAPRFFREGDTIWLIANINNIAGEALKGIANLELRDALTGKVISISQTPLEQTFDIADKNSQIVKWRLTIPKAVSAITYKVFAQTKSHTDGEEMTIPVLANSMLITEAMSLNVRGNTTKTFEMEKLLKSEASKTLRTQSLTLEYTRNPAWYAVQALPYLMEYTNESAEQSFSRFYANSFATGIVNSSPKIKQVFEQWKQSNSDALLSNLEKNQQLKSILLEETPWLRNAESETERKKRIALLLDLNRMSYELKENFEQLEKMQLNNGAFPWFSGMREDRYITQHIVMGMGQLLKANLVDQKSLPKFQTMINKAISYLDLQLVKDYNQELKENGMSRLPLHYLLARSYFDQTNNDENFQKASKYYLQKTKQTWTAMGVYQQAQAAIILSRNQQHGEALKVIDLLKQIAQHNEETGMYWPTNHAGWWWYENPIETQALLITSFDEVANDQKSVEEMKIWLLKYKETNNWGSSKATAAACYALLMRGYDLLSDNEPAQIKLGTKSINDYKAPQTTLEVGTGYEKINISGNIVKPAMGKVTVTNKNNGISWGALYWQYFEKLDKITPSANGLKINKQLYLQRTTAKGDVLIPLNEANTLNLGDVVKVRIEIHADRAMEYLHLKDMRSSGFEPVNVLSGYRYQDGLSYYESTKDASTNFFINRMSKGIYIFEYTLKASHAGRFSNGVTSLQSMYTPAFTSYSEGTTVNVK